MDDPPESMVALTAYACGAGAASAIPMLCRRLAEQGLLTGRQIEEIRHYALLGFDMLRERKGLSEAENKHLETVRGHADQMWQIAALSAESQG